MSGMPQHGLHYCAEAGRRILLVGRAAVKSRSKEESERSENKSEKKDVYKLAVFSPVATLSNKNT